MFPTFPAVTQALLNHPDYRPETSAEVRITNNVAPPDTLRAMQAAMPQAIQISAYGLTECGGVVSFNDPDDTLRAADDHPGPALRRHRGVRQGRRGPRA